MDDDPEQAAGRIRLLPAGHLFGRFDLVINVDSLVEMPLKTAVDHLRLIAKYSRLFLSINHGFRGVPVEEIVKNVSPTSQARSKPYPMREGYTESCFVLAMPVKITPEFKIRYNFTRSVISIRYRCQKFLSHLFTKLTRLRWCESARPFNARVSRSER